MMAPASVSLFNLLQFLTLFVCKSGSHLSVRIDKDLMDPAPGLLPNVSELGSCFVDDRRNPGDLFGSEIKLHAESVLHSRGDSLWMM